jgi:hypothetical protein
MLSGGKVRGWRFWLVSTRVLYGVQRCPMWAVGPTWTGDSEIILSELQ